MFVFLISASLSANVTAAANATRAAASGDSGNSFFVQLAALALVFAVCFLSYNFGKQGLRAQVQLLREALQESLGVDVPEPTALGLHEYLFSVPLRRRGVYEVVIRAQFSQRCDPLNLLRSSMSKVSNVISVEFSVFQAHKISAMIHLSKDRPFFLNDFRLIDRDICEGYKVFSDVHKEIDDIVSAFRKYVTANPKTVNFIEMSDMNRFETKQRNRYVSYCQFHLDTHITKQKISEIMNFGFAITELFSAKSVSETSNNKNRVRREKLVSAAKERMERVKKNQEELLQNTEKKEEHEKAE